MMRKTGWHGLMKNVGSHQEKARLEHDSLSVSSNGSRPSSKKHQTEEEKGIEQFKKAVAWQQVSACGGIALL